MSCGRLLIGVAVATGAVALSSACSGSGYQFMENEDRGVFARVPDDWAVYDEDDLYRVLVPDAPADEGPPEQLWYRGFDASDSPSIDGIHGDDLAFDHPQGFVQVQPLTSAEREQVNISMLRAFFLRADPMAATQQEADGALSVLNEEPAEFAGGYHGVHTLIAVRGNSGGAIVDQTVVLDDTSSVVYVFVVACSDRCYSDTYKDEIANVVGSWTIQEEDGT